MKSVHVLATPVLVGASADGAVASVAQNESDSYRKMFLRVEDVQGRNCLTNFWVRPAACAPRLVLRAHAVHSDMREVTEQTSSLVAQRDAALRPGRSASYA